MRGTVTISNKTVELKATASTLRKYRNMFNRDLLTDFRKIQMAFTNGEEVSGEAIDIIGNLTYIMAKQANPDITNNIEDWLDEFDTFPVEEFALDVVQFWAQSLKANIQLKNV